MLLAATNGVTFSIARSLTLIAWLTFNSEMFTITKSGRSLIKPFTLRRGILTLSLPPRITPGDVPSVRTGRVTVIGFSSVTSKKSAWRTSSLSG